MENLRKVIVRQDTGSEKKGYFHQWGNKTEYSEQNGDFPVIVGVLEYEDGRVDSVEPRRIRFSEW